MEEEEDEEGEWRSDSSWNEEVEMEPEEMAK